jgi:hypothetical protein
MSNVYASINVFWAIKSRTVMWAEYAVSVGQMRNADKILFEKPERSDNLDDLRVVGKIILEWILGK